MFFLWGKKSNYEQLAQSQMLMHLLERSHHSNSELLKLLLLLLCSWRAGLKISTQEMLNWCKEGMPSPKGNFLDFIVKEHFPSPGWDFQSCSNKNLQWKKCTWVFPQFIVIQSVQLEIELIYVILLIYPVSSSVISVAGWIRLQIICCPIWWITAMSELVANPALVISLLRCGLSFSVQG